jgi:hypothetical protein
VTTLDDLEQRVAAIEERLGTEHSIQALAITQSQHNEQLGRHEQSLATAHDKLDRIITMLQRLAGDGSS